jgi:predicted metal-dependent phosphoesterase TrpH
MLDSWHGKGNNEAMKIEFVDLHLHSTCSDGLFSPEEIVDLAEKAGLAAIALADHDNIDGISRAMQAGADAGIEIIAAVELSSQWLEYTDMHLLGYGFDYQDPYLIRALAEFQEFRTTRNRQIVERVNQKLLAEQRQPLDPDAVSQLAGGTIGRPHIALALRQAGYASNNEDAFVRYLVPCNVPKRFFPADDAIKLLHGSGGIVVLAHPPYVTRDRHKLELLVADLVNLGLDGIEAYNNGSGLEDTDWLIKLARQHGLVVTGGSDFHGDGGSIIEVGKGVRGLQVPYDCVEEIKMALRKLRGE